MTTTERAIRQARDKKEFGGYTENIQELGKLFGEDQIEQTGVRTDSQISGTVVEEAYNDFLEEYYGITDHISALICDHRNKKSPSKDGRGRKDLVEILKQSLPDENHDNKNKLTRVP